MLTRSRAAIRSRCSRRSTGVIFANSAAILYKDIVKRFKIRSVQGSSDLALYLMSNMAREYSLNALSGVTKCRSVHTVDKYIRYLQEAYLVFFASALLVQGEGSVGSK